MATPTITTWIDSTGPAVHEALPPARFPGRYPVPGSHDVYRKNASDEWMFSYHRPAAEA